MASGAQEAISALNETDFNVSYISKPAFVNRGLLSVYGPVSNCLIPELLDMLKLTPMRTTAAILLQTGPGMRIQA